MTAAGGAHGPLRPADLCRALLAALDAADGRRRRRKRDQTPDAFGISVKRALLARAVEEDPEPEAFEAWLLEYPASCRTPGLMGPAQAMARTVFEEWRLAHTLGAFRSWLDEGAPSADAVGQNEEVRSQNEKGRMKKEE